MVTGFVIGLKESTTKENEIETPEASNNWLNGWNYRKNHTINSATGAGTNYQIKFTVYKGNGIESDEKIYCNGNCQNNFSDLRFTDGDGVTELDYWMESYTSGINATFWVKIQGDLTSNVDICVYYGKSDAISTSNFDTTFPVLSDDFEDGIIGSVPNNWYEIEPELGSHFNISDDYYYNKSAGIQ